jgi:hypothetical protein
VSRDDAHEDPRRRWLLRALAAGWFAAGLPRMAGAAPLLGRRPRPLPPGQSIYRLSGDVRVDGQVATAATAIRAGQTVETGADGEIAFVVNKDAYLLRASSKLVLEPLRNAASTVSRVKMMLGKLLAVFAPGEERRVETATMVTGIRGTGVYVESDPGQTYFCTCYGIVDIGALGDAASRETIESKHHDQPRYILGKATDGKFIRPAPFINHTDAELMMLEALVGRTPPFVFPDDRYTGPRRDY